MSLHACFLGPLMMDSVASHASFDERDGKVQLSDFDHYCLDLVHRHYYQ